MLLVQKCIVAITAVYLFDTVSYPFIHVPLTVLTVLYLSSAAEIWGISRVVGWVRRHV